jgi:hypothetical protein
MPNAYRITSRLFQEIGVRLVGSVETSMTGLEDIRKVFMKYRERVSRENSPYLYVC